MRKLNVCLMNDSFPPAIDGVANAVTNYARIISRDYGRASVVTPYYPDADDSRFDFPVLRYPSLDMTKKIGYRAGLPFSAELLGKLEKADYDLIHSHCPVTATLLARTLRDRIDVPIVFTYHTKFDIDIANAVRGKFLQEEAARLLVENISACDEVWTVSRGAGENLRRLGYQGDWRVMPNGVDFPRGRVTEELIRQVTGDFSLPENVPVFLFVGRMMWYKGIRIILDALKKLVDSGVDFRMVFVGGGGDKDEITAYTETLGLTERVLFVPPIQERDQIRAWYCRADLFLFPSTFDTNGLVVREAAACALPSVLVAGSCAAEDVRDGETGFLIEENADSMAATLHRLCDARETLRRVGENAAEGLYMSWEDSVAGAYRRYGQVLDGYRSGRLYKHDGVTDDLLHGLAQTMDRMNRGRERQQQLRREYEELLRDVEAQRRQRREERQSEYDEMRAELQEERRRLRERWEELLQRMDRFL